MPTDDHRLADYAAILSRADAYDDAVRALSEVRGPGPLSTTIGYLIRAGYLVPADPRATSTEETDDHICEPVYCHTCEARDYDEAAR